MRIGGSVVRGSARQILLLDTLNTSTGFSGCRVMVTPSGETPRDTPDRSTVAVDANAGHA